MLEYGTKTFFRSLDWYETGGILGEDELVLLRTTFKTHKGLEPHILARNGKLGTKRGVDASVQKLVRKTTDPRAEKNSVAASVLRRPRL